MVNNYPLERCKYLTGRLKPFVYLLPKETTKIDYVVDTKQRKPYPSFCEISSIQYTNCIKLEGFLTTLNITESSDNRLDFSSNVSLSMLEQWNNTWVSLLEELKLMNCYVIVEDVEGTQYIQTPEFPSYFTYTYDFGNEGNGNVAQIRYTCDCNFPLVYVRNNVTATTTYKGNCNYIIGGAKNLKMTPYQYAYAINDVNTGNFSIITCTGGEVMHDVEFLKGSFSFRQEYNGRNYNERLVFKIPLSKYKYIFRYNLVEFNLNRYAITFETNEGNWIAAGFEFGFQPTYTVETSDTDEDLNTIEITLHHSGQNSILWCEGTPEIVDSHTELYVPIGAYIKDEETSEMLLTLHCVNKTYAINTLAEMVTESGVRTGKYLCLNDPEYGDWREYYRHFNIVGTYDSNSDLGFELTTSSSLCAAFDNCNFIKMTKEVYSFSKAGSYYDTFVENPCPWDLKAVPNWINVTMYDEEDGSKRVRFTSRENPTDQRKIDLGYVQSFDNTSTVQFILEKKADWINPAEFEITAKKQTLTSYVDVPYDEYEICSIPEGLTAEKVEGTSMLKINVPQNDEETGTRTFEVELCRNDGERGTITIHQDHLYVEWREDVGNFICVDGTSYRKIDKWIGYDIEHIDILTEESVAGEKLIDDDPRCEYQDTRIYRWVTDTGETVCMGGDKYEREDYQVSTDNGETWTTIEYRVGELIEESSEECEGEPETKFIDDQERYTCDGINSYYVAVQYESMDGEIWVKTEPEVTQTGSLRLANDPDCGGGQTIYQWVEDGTTICEYEEEPQETERWIDVAGEYICDGYNKYQKQKKQIYSGGDWIDTTQTRNGELIEANSSDCGYVEETEEWRTIENTFICLDGNKYLAVQRYYKVNGAWTTDGEIDKGILIETNSSDCDSFEQGIMYEYTICGTEDWDCINGYRVYPTTKKVNTDGTGFVWMTIGEECSFTSRGIYPTSCENEGVTLYRWTDTPSTICDCGNEYQKQIQEVSMDDGTTWTPNGVERKGQLIQEQSENCESDRMERWVNVTGDYICEGTDKYQKQRLEYSYDGGDTWIAQTDTRKGSLIESSSTDCGYVENYRWVNSGTTCVGYDKYNMMKQQIKRNGVWTDTGLTQRGSLIETNSIDCGYNPVDPSFYKNQPFTMEFLQDTCFSLGSFKDKYSIRINDGQWKVITDGYCEFIEEGSTVQIKSRQKIEDPAHLPTFTNCSTPEGVELIGFNLSGNINSLVEGDNLTETAYHFFGYFGYMTDWASGRRSFNNNIISAENLYLPGNDVRYDNYAYMFANQHKMVKGPKILPARNVYDKAYQGMFFACDKMTTAPEIMATNLYGTNNFEDMFQYCTSLRTPPSVLYPLHLTYRCYKQMFDGCSALETAPDINATSLSEYSCESMFNACSSLRTAPTALYSDVLYNNCYLYMFAGCSALETAPELLATTLTERCYSQMFTNCTHLTKAPSILPATILTDGCYYHMFQGCTSLETAPVLPAETLAKDCYTAMFAGCSSLNYIKAMFKTLLPTGIGYWVQNVALDGTFVMNANARWNPEENRGINGVPNGWIVETATE